MPRRLILPAAALIVALIAAALWLLPQRDDDAPPHLLPPASHAPPLPPQALDIPGNGDDGGAMAHVLPMHQAVRLAAQRFHGKPLDITLVAPRPDEAAAGVLLVYRIRMLTRSSDVLDIRMDAVSGRFLELSGADLTGVHRKPGDRKKRKD